MAQSIKCSCIICKKEFSIKGIHSHYITYHTSEGNERVKKSGKLGSLSGATATALKFQLIREQQMIEYSINPKLCKHCNNIIPFEKRNSNVFCSSNCSASYNNKIKDYTKAKETWKKKRENNSPKIKILKPVIKTKKTKTTNVIPEIVGEYSKLKLCSCQHCGIVKLYRTQKKYCKECDHLYSHDGRAKYWFRFNVFHYPELFDLSLITRYGFRDNKTNPNGITRDHKVSVNEAIRNNYDPYYIKHPMNCELMFFEENNKKKTKSSITYEELIKLVDDFDSKKRS